MSVAIVGGGASGLMAACLLSRAGVEALVLEKQPRVGRKLLSTGNGRCNLSNLSASPADYHGDARYLSAALRAFAPDAVCAFFGELGVPCAPDAQGRVYPMSNQAASVLDALRLYARERGCAERVDFGVSAIRRAGAGFELEAADGARVRADHVIVACGALAAPKLGGCADGYRLLEGFGHKIAPRHPAIAPLRSDAAMLRPLKGIRARAALTLCANGVRLRREAGEVLFGEDAVSGIAAMQLARAANLAIARGEKCALQLDFYPDAPEDFIDRRAAALPERAMEDFLSGVVPKRLGQVLIKAAGVAPLSLTARALAPGQRRAIGRELRGWTLPVSGTLGYDAAQACCGGACLSEFDPDTLESRRARGLFAVGEVLDVDGDCGGFNLQWAWASAALAANEIIRRGH